MDPVTLGCEEKKYKLEAHSEDMGRSKIITKKRKPLKGCRAKHSNGNFQLLSEET